MSRTVKEIQADLQKISKFLATPEPVKLSSIYERMNKIADILDLDEKSTQTKHTTPEPSETGAIKTLQAKLFKLADEITEEPNPTEDVPGIPNHEEEPVNVQTDEDYLSWLEGTLIPDLHESGKQNTADDLSEGVMIAKGMAEGSVSQSVAQEYVNYLNGTLIPDLQESGQEETASDFQHLVQIISKGGIPGEEEEALAEPVEEPMEPEPEQE